MSRCLTSILWGIIIGVVIVAIICALNGCTSAEWQAYNSTVDSRSIEGYAKDSDYGAQGGIKYTVHYK